MFLKVYKYTIAPGSSSVNIMGKNHKLPRLSLIYVKHIIAVIKRWADEHNILMYTEDFTGSDHIKIFFQKPSDYVLFALSWPDPTVLKFEILNPTNDI